MKKNMQLADNTDIARMKLAVVRHHPAVAGEIQSQ